MDSIYDKLPVFRSYEIDPLLHDAVLKYHSNRREVNYMDSVLYDAVTKDDIDVLEEMDIEKYNRRRPSMEMEGKLPVDEQRTATNSTVLHLACQYGSIKCVQHILRAHKSLLLIINTNLETALHLAAREGYYEVAAALLNAAKSLVLNPKSYKYLDTSLTAKEIFIRIGEAIDSTAMHVAVRHNHKNVVQFLLNEYPQFSYPHHGFIHEHGGGTPLYLASIRRYGDIIRTIYENSDSPAFGGPKGRTALHAALLDDGENDDCVKLLLEKNRDIIKEADRYGWTAFHYVANNDLHTIVEDLVVADKSVGYLVDEYHKKTALHVAAYQGNVRVMIKLVEYYPDLWESVDWKDKNILHIAVEQDQKEVIKFILSQGCKKVNNLLIRMDKEGNTPLHIIAKLGCYVEEFMDLKTFDWEVPNSKGLTSWDLLDSERTPSADHTKIRIALTQAKPKRQYLRLQEVEMHDVDVERAEERKKLSDSKEKLKRTIVEMTEKGINTHIIVAALITTVALTSGFAMPGGFNSTEGKNQGSAMLLKKAAFQAFIITDAIALLLSISSLFLYFFTILIKDVNVKLSLDMFDTAIKLNLFSMMAMMVAFITGTYAVLAPSSALAISVCIISSSFFLFLFYVSYKFIRFLVGIWPQSAHYLRENLK